MTRTQAVVAVEEAIEYITLMLQSSAEDDGEAWLITSLDEVVRYLNRDIVEREP